MSLRAPSSALAVSRAMRWIPLGLPNFVVRYGIIASSARGESGVVAALSAYT